MSETLTRHPGALPADVEPYRRTDIFTERTLPAGLRKNHSTKAGVWALIHVLEGKLRYCVPGWNHEELLEPGAPGIVAPQVEHFVEPQGVVRVFVEFHERPGGARTDPHAAG